MLTRLIHYALWEIRLRCTRLCSGFFDITEWLHSNSSSYPIRCQFLCFFPAYKYFYSKRSRIKHIVCKITMHFFLFCCINYNLKILCWNFSLPPHGWCNFACRCLRFYEMGSRFSGHSSLLWTLSFKRVLIFL